MELRKLIKDLNIRFLSKGLNVEIAHITYDSRKVASGDLFVAMKGHAMDGHDFIGNAVLRGAAAILSELPPEAVLQKMDVKQKPVPVIVQVENSRKALAELALAFYGHPFRGMNLVGITGTNGKTTTSYLLESILAAAGRTPGVIGTINRRLGHLKWDSNVTTPESLDLMGMLREMANHSATDVIMEVSSHALDQGRIAGCPFKTVLFTNISRDHLDYHQSMEKYFEAKSLLFTEFVRNTDEHDVCAVINRDDPFGRRLMSLTSARILTYGFAKESDVTAKEITHSLNGLSAKLTSNLTGEFHIRSSLLGDYDIYNIMAAACAAISLGIDPGTIATGIKDLKGVPGRMEPVPNDRSLAILVDYAHTPDALEKALHAAKQIARGETLIVFGCGGDRDKGKRFEMGQIAGSNSSRVFITSDNPRSENPAAIAQEIERGVIASGQKNYVVELKRETAIKMALDAAAKGDLVLIAGKGHETYQIIGKTKRVFDDRVVAREAASLSQRDQ